MKILAVSDVQNQSLVNILENTPEKYSDIDCVVSCGDLESDYLDKIVETLGIKLFFVSGNHVFRDETCSEVEQEDTVGVVHHDHTPSRPCIAGTEDIHGRVEVFGDYIMAGFGGSMWYSGRENQFTEKQMRNIVRSVEKRIRWIRLIDSILRRKRKEIVVLSHAPVYAIHDLPDLCHKGFECFGNFIQKYSPLAWLHGHVHPNGDGRPQVSRLGDTYVINVYGCKILEFKDKEVMIKHHC